MLEYSIFDRVMGPETISKNGASPKSHTSRRNKLLVVICMLLFSCTAFGQQIKSKNVEIDDLVELFRASGFELFSFDITDMLKERYDIVFVYKEYDKSGEIFSRNLSTAPNKRLLTDIPESSWQQFIDAGKIIDSETKAFFHAEKFYFGFFPSGNDSTVRVQVAINNNTDIVTLLKLRGLSNNDSDKKIFLYHKRPFSIEAFKEDTFIPLVLFGSSWHDEKFDIYRFCGERVINPDMSSVILKDVPHYYVFGVIFRKKQ